jgi:hypothetical protein
LTIATGGLIVSGCSVVVRRPGMVPNLVASPALRSVMLATKQT